MTKKEWEKKYIERMMLAGVDKKFSTECYNAGEHDYKECPVEMAESEMSYWDT